VWQTTKQIVERQARVSAACMMYGAAYVALCATATGYLEASILWAVPLALVGGLVGAIGGLVASVLRNITGPRFGWCLAGFIGGCAPGVLLLALYPPHSSGTCFPDMNPTVSSLVVWPSLIGAGLGLTVDYRLRTGRSLLPGVQRLATVLNDCRPPGRLAVPHGAAAEVTPAHALQGRGDEAEPAEGEVHDGA
jgi:hypothetical protein